MKSKSSPKVLTVLLVLAMLLSFVPANATAQAANPPQLVTVDQSVQDDMQKNGVATYWVEFENTADLSPAYSMNWHDRGWFVYNTLKEQADRTQAQAIQVLENAGTTYESFWINNSILVTQSNNQILTSLQSLPNVTGITAQETYILYEPENIEGVEDEGSKAVEPSIAQIKAPEAWALGIRGEGLTIANIDTGVRYTHQALVNSYRGNNGDGTFDHNYNWFSPASASDNVPRDGQGHGTHVMGTMVGDDGGANQVGVAPGADWIACSGCYNGSCADSYLTSCAQFMAAPTNLQGNNPNPDLRPVAVNNSWGDCVTSFNTFYVPQIAAWHAAGIYPLFANGNNSNCGYQSNPPLNTVGNPGRHGNVSGVGSTSNTGGNYANHSNKGPTDNLDIINPTDGFDMVKPQFSTPGVNIRSTVRASDTSYQSSGWTGTSMSTPAATGVVALVMQAAPCLVGNYAVVENILESTANPILYDDGSTITPTNHPNFATGWGELNALAAVQTASGMCASSTISGTVKDADGNGIANAKLQFAGTKGFTDQTIYANEQGEYSTLIGSDIFKLNVTALGFFPHAEENIIIEDDATITKNIVLTNLPISTISGVVTDGGMTGSTAKHGYPLYAKLSFTAEGQTTEVLTDPFTGAYSVDIFQSTVYNVSVEALTTDYLMHFDTVSTTQNALTYNVALKVPALACPTAGYFSDSTSARFDNSSLPKDWTVVNYLPNGQLWAFNDPSQRGNKTGGSGGFATVDSASYPAGSSQTTGLQTPVMDFSKLNSVKLDFDSYYENGEGFNAIIRFTQNNGVSWRTIQNMPKQTEQKHYSLDLTSALAGKSNVIVEFRVLGKTAGYWQIDNIMIGDLSCEIVSGGVVAGYVTDADNGNARLMDALVESNKGFATTSASLDPAGNGLYWFFQPTAASQENVSFTVSKTGYGPSIETRTVKKDLINRNDFQLSTGGIIIPDDFSLYLPLVQK